MRGFISDALMIKEGPFRKWAGTGVNTTITYTFLNFMPSYYNMSNPLHADFANGFRSFSSTERQYVASLFSEVQRIGAVTFGEVQQNAATDSVGDLTFASSDFPTNPSVFGQVAGLSDPQLAGDVWLHDASLNPGEGLITVLHEGGHALGLRHAFIDGPTGPAGSYYTKTPSETEQWSVMPYTVYSGYAGVNGGHPTGLQFYDVAALHYIYGPNNATNAGNTTYTYGAGARTYTIWDGNGEAATTDIIDVSAVTTDSIVDLRPGSNPAGRAIFSELVLGPPYRTRTTSLARPPWSPTTIEHPCQYAAPPCLRPRCAYPSSRQQRRACLVEHRDVVMTTSGDFR